MGSLYQLSKEYMALLDESHEDEGFEETLCAIGDAWVEKIINIAKLVRNIEAEADAIKQAEEAMAERRKGKTNKAKRLRNYIMQNMGACSNGRIETTEFLITLRDNPLKVEIAQGAVIPEKFMKQPPAEPDKTAIREAILGNIEVPGCTLSKSQRIDIK